MRKRTCQQQSMILETRLNIHVSRCENRACKYYLNPVSEEICNSCSQKVSIEGEDELANSMADDVYNVKLDERSDQTVVHIFNNHCEKCSHYSKKDGMCIQLTCEYAIPIKSLMRNPSIHCPLRLW